MTIGQVSEDFVNHFVDKPEDELIDYLYDLSCGDNDSDIPDPVEDYDEWYDINDIEYLDGAAGQTTWSWVEIPVDAVRGSRESMVNEGEGEEFEPHHLYDREAYFDSNDEAKEDYPEDKVVPVLMYYSTEKGSMGCWFVETDGEDFDPKKVAYSTVNTNVEEMLEDVWYDKEELEEQHEYKSTNGKGDYASVGWMNLNWHDTKESSQKDMDEQWLDWQKEQEDEEAENEGDKD